jgi:hypothetical protein
MDELKTLAQRAPVKYRGLYERSLRGSLAPRSAIKLKCLECVCWQRMEGGIDQIKDCTVRGCPLWAVRPFQKAPRSRHVAPSATSSKELG